MCPGLIEEEIHERRLDIMAIGWTLLKAEVTAVEIRDNLNIILGHRAKDRVLEVHQWRAWEEAEKGSHSIELPKTPTKR
jgi:hypothetical protein